jgi:hypothetical protein
MNRNVRFSTLQRLKAAAMTTAALAVCLAGLQAGNIYLPNASFELPLVPPESPYAISDMDSWQKSAQPAGYDPATNNYTPWDYLMGTFYNVPFPGVFIDNCDGNQAAFLFALPEVGLFQDYTSLSGTNTTPSHAFNALFNMGKAYTLTVGVIGGGGGMKPGATLQLSLYYRDALSNQVIVAATTVTNNSSSFPTNTHFVNYQVQVPGVKATDLWAGKNIGIQLLSTVDPVSGLAGGYWDVDNVHLVETVAPAFTNCGMTNGHFTANLLSEPGARFELQAASPLTAGTNMWSSLENLTNVTGVATFTDTNATLSGRFYRARQLW